jgi:hypothetical protein
MVLIVPKILIALEVRTNGLGTLVMEQVGGKFIHHVVEKLLGLILPMKLTQVV